MSLDLVNTTLISRQLEQNLLDQKLDPQREENLEVEEKGQRIGLVLVNLTLMILLPKEVQDIPSELDNVQNLELRAKKMSQVQETIIQNRQLEVKGLKSLAVNFKKTVPLKRVIIQVLANILFITLIQRDQELK